MRIFLSLPGNSGNIIMKGENRYDMRYFTYQPTWKDRSWSTVIAPGQYPVFSF